MTTDPLKLTRCGSVSPEYGWRCGLPAGHDGEHTVLVPSDAPWFDDFTDMRAMGEAPPLAPVPAAPVADGVRVPRALLAELREDLCKLDSGKWGAEHFAIVGRIEQIDALLSAPSE